MPKTLGLLMASSEGLMRYVEAAEYLAVGKSTLYSLVSRGEIRVVRFGAGKTGKGVTRFRREDLERFIMKKLAKR